MKSALAGKGVSEDEIMRRDGARCVRLSGLSWGTVVSAEQSESTNERQRHGRRKDDCFRIELKAGTGWEMED
jgi:hypothetical protein